MSEKPKDNGVLSAALEKMKSLTDEIWNEFLEIHSRSGIMNHPLLQGALDPFSYGRPREGDIDYSGYVRLLMAIKETFDRDDSYGHFYELLRGRKSGAVAAAAAAATDKLDEYPPLPSCVELAAFILFNIFKLNDEDRDAEFEKPPTLPGEYRNGELEYYGFPIEENPAYIRVCEALNEPPQVKYGEYSDDDVPQDLLPFFPTFYDF